MKSVFCSYKYEDKQWKEKLESWAISNRLGPNIVITGESEDVRQNGKNAVKRHLSPKLTGASKILVLIGRDTHNSTGVEYEIQHAMSAGKKVIPVRIPDTSGAAPQAISGKREIVFDPSAIRQELESW